MSYDNVNDLLALKDLLGQTHEEEMEHKENKKITPATIVDQAALVKASSSMCKKIGAFDENVKKTSNSKDIWMEHEIPNEEDVEDWEDQRKRPKFEILYKQNVMTEDVFLGIGDKDPSTLHCDSIVYRIEFPKHQIKDIDLEVTKTKIVAQSSTLKLAMYLPHPVDKDQGKAKWDGKNETLVVTLPIIRDEW